MFIQPLWERIDNVTLEGNLFAGGGFNLALEKKTGYSNMKAINNRFTPTGYGPSVVQGGPGYAVWQDNYRFDPTMPNSAGSPVDPGFYGG
jgi:hypothetical protein